MSDDPKRRAAEAALDEVPIGAVIGIGTGSTAEAFIALLAERVRDGMLVSGIATSERTQTLCVRLGIEMTDLERSPVPDVAIDGADEFDPRLDLIKGGGGALLREKIVAAAAKRFVVIVDESKRVQTLGRFPLPIEVSQFGIEATRIAVDRVCRAHGMTGELMLRLDADAEPVRTDNGNRILDAQMNSIADPAALGAALVAVPGVVEHGLFVGMADLVIVGGPDGTQRIERTAG